MFDNLFKYLLPVIRLVTNHAVFVLSSSLILAIIGLAFALNLRIDNDFTKLIPNHYPSVQALEQLREQVGGSNEVAVVIESSSFDTNLKYAETLIPRAMQLQNPSDRSPYFLRYEFRKETGFLESNALYFATDDELDLLENFLDDEIENARLEANPFYFEFDQETGSSDSIRQQLQNTYDELIGSEYPISPDSLVMAVRFYPAGSQSDVGYIRNIYRDLDQLTSQLVKDFNESDIQVVLAGRLLRTLIEIDSIYIDVRDSFGAGVLMLLIMVVAYFFYKNYRIRSGNVHSVKVMISELIRTPVTALIMGLPLVISLCWTFGVTWLTYETLNIMTSTLALLLFGMGIDFGIHFYARYVEERSDGSSVPVAVETTFMTTGKAITAVGVTTAAAFFILMFADFKGFSEFGFIAGTGILFSIICMIIVMPAMLVLLEKNNLLKPVPAFQSGSVKSVNENGSSSQRMKIISIIIIIIGLTATLVSTWYAPNLSFEYDFGKLEPDYEEYNRVASEARKVYSDRRTRNAAYIIADNPDDALEIKEILTARISTDTLTSTIRTVEILQDRLPFTKSEQQDKLKRIEEIRHKLDDQFLSSDESDQLQLLRKSASTVSPIDFDQIPGFLIDPFTAKDGTIGNLVIIYPSVTLADGRNSMNFADDLSDILLDDGRVYYAGSTSIVASDMLRLLIREAPWMVALTLTFIIIIKLLIFGSLKWMLLALLPLAASFMWLFGIMDLAGWKLNFYNMVVLPTILGIGDDSGIHIVHRYIEEGKGSIAKVLRSTGEHITISAMTTMLGFAGLLFSGHPGMRSIGEMAVTGIALMLIAALFLLPALLYLFEKK
jgi:uncharacterized protein